MKPFYEFTRYVQWKDRFLEDRERIRELEKEYEGTEEPRLLKAILSMYVGGMEKRIKDEEIKRWTDWGGKKTYQTFNGFPQLSDEELSFLFYSLGKLFVPLLLHEKGVKSETFKRLPPKEQEDAVLEVLDTLWENHLIRILQILPYMGLNSNTK